MNILDRIPLVRLTRMSESTLEALPKEVIIGIEEASITLRPGGDMPRAVVQFAGQIGFIHSVDITPVNIARTWPFLTAEQVRRAARYVHRQVLRACREAGEYADPRRAKKAPSWAMRW